MLMLPCCHLHAQCTHKKLLATQAPHLQRTWCNQYKPTLKLQILQRKHAPDQWKHTFNVHVLQWKHAANQWKHAAKWQPLQQKHALKLQNFAVETCTEVVESSWSRRMASMRCVGL